MKLKETLLFNPAISSLNMGDHIIADGVKNQLSPLINNSFFVEVSTHLPISNSYMRHLKNVDYKFVGGSNLLRGKMNRPFRQWDINLTQIEALRNSILVGVGWWQYGDEPNKYTKILYSNILSKNYLHSVRDEYTKLQLKKIGIENVINTSCATMWNLTEEHCEKIPKNKSRENVIFTLTDYNRDSEKDKMMIEILQRNYKNVYFWVQGKEDLSYIETLNINLEEIIIVPPSLQAFDQILKSTDIDYIGTRLHGGIRALQYKRRTIIIGIDNRAFEKKKDFNIVVVNRKEIESIEEIINSTFNTEILLPINNILEWKNQFV